MAYTIKRRSLFWHVWPLRRATYELLEKFIEHLPEQPQTGHHNILISHLQPGICYITFNVEEAKKVNFLTILISFNWVVVLTNQLVFSQSMNVLGRIINRGASAADDGGQNNTI